MKKIIPLLLCLLFVSVGCDKEEETLNGTVWMDEDDEVDDRHKYVLVFEKSTVILQSHVECMGTYEDPEVIIGSYSYKHPEAIIIGLDSEYPVITAIISGDKMTFDIDGGRTFTKQ